MSAIIVSLLLSIGTQVLRYGITALFEARKLRRPDMRDKEGVRIYLINLLGWSAYLHRLFFPDLQTIGFTIAVVMEICKNDETWNTFYLALAHDFGINVLEFPPQKYAPSPEPEPDKRRRRITRLCRSLRGRNIMNSNVPDDYTTDAERNAAEEYLAFARNLLDHPSALCQTQSTYAAMFAANNRRG
jgi:hypothetical protein